MSTAVPRGAVTYKVRKAIQDAADAANSVASTDITDATTVGKAVLTAASAAAARTATGAQQVFVSAPGTATSSGTANQIAFDATHFYVCIATNTWVRGTLATW